MSSRAKHAQRSHRSYKNKYSAFNGFYYHAPRGNKLKFHELPIIGKLFSLFKH